MMHNLIHDTPVCIIKCLFFCNSVDQINKECKELLFVDLFACFIIIICFDLFNIYNLMQTLQKIKTEFERFYIFVYCT